MASVVERLPIFSGSTVASPASLDFSATVTSGDVVLLFLNHYSAADAPTWSVSGLGATWTSVARLTEGNPGDTGIVPVTEVFKVTAASDGAITVTASTTWRGGYYALLLRDVSASMSAATVVLHDGTSTSITGPSQSAANGQIVVDNAIITNSNNGGFSTFGGYTPATGWTTETQNGGGLYTVIGGAYRVPSGSAETHQVTDSGSSTRVYRLTQVVVGDAAGGAITGMVNVTDHADTAVVSGTVTAVPVTGIVTVADHADTAVLSGTVSGVSVTGVIDVTDHADVAVVEGTVTGAPITGTVSVTDHPDEAILYGTVGSAAPVVAGTVEVVDKPDLAVVYADTATTEQDGQDTYPTRTYARLGYLTIPPAALPPAGVTPRPVQRRSHVVPVLTGATAPLTEGLDYPAVTPVNEGTLHVFVDGVDVTYLGGIPIQAVQFSKVGPLGDVAASFELPGMQAWDKPGVGDFAAIDPSTDAPVEAVIVDDEGNRTHLFKGFLSADRAQVGESKRNGFTAEGVLWQAGHTIHEPPHYLPPTDIGTVIPRLLNSVPSRRYNDVPEVVTGLMTRHRGAGNQYVDQVILDILAKDGWTDDGQQWTLEQVGPDDFRMVLKPATDGTYDDTVTYGAFGIDVSLSREQTSRADVIYGRGTTAAGGQWRGTRFPGLILANPLPYPNNDASSMHLGDNDGDTDSGTGVSDWQRRMNELGYGLRVDGTLNSNDIDVVRRLQRSMGLLVDGVIGPQTWAGSFNRGPEGIDLTQWREPIAWEPWTQPYLRDPNGVILSDNPDYDSTRIPHQIEVDFGAPITWREAQPPSRRMLAVESTAGLTGTIRMRTDFHNSWRGLAKPGMRVRVLGFQGESPVVRVAAVDAGVDADGFYVDLTVDERARDALSVDQILERNRAAMADPARRPGNPNRDSRNERDRFVQWDVDSPCGFMPRTAVFGGLWVAPNPIPFSEVGRVVRIVMSSTVPFVMGIFGLPVKPSQLQAIVGNPLADSDPWRPHTDALEALGWIDGWGSQGQRMGYYPGDEGSGYAFTGKTDLRGAWDYISGYPPYVWPLFYSATTGFIGGGSGDWVSRFYPATGD